MKLNKNSNCPCGSNRLYKDCCKIYHKGIVPKTSLELMKARFSAYVIGDAEFIMRTTHPQNEQFRTSPKQWRSEILYFSKTTHLEELKILKFEEDEHNGFVEFNLIFIQDNVASRLHEKSYFVKSNEEWLYIKGEFVFSQLS